MSGTLATPVPATDTASEPKNPPVLIPSQEKQQKENSAPLVRDEGASSESQQQEEVDKADCSKAEPLREQEEEERQLQTEEEEEVELINEVVAT